MLSNKTEDEQYKKYFEDKKRREEEYFIKLFSSAQKNADESRTLFLKDGVATLKKDKSISISYNGELSDSDLYTFIVRQI